MDRCDECGFEYASVAATAVPAALRDGAQRVVEVFRGDVRAHPIEGTWSALEYACHVRDVMDVQRGRLALALAEDCPFFTPFGREERAVLDCYDEQDPELVAAQVLAEAFGALTDDELARTGTYTWPTEAERDLLWVGRHTVHELAHHRDDMIKVLSAGTR